MTPRRSVLAALAGAPVLAGAGIATATPAAISSLANLSGLDEAGLLEAGARCSDAAFASLCADALEKIARAEAAGALSDDAEEAVERATPEYPAGLRYRCRYRHTSGERAGQVDEWEERCEPDGVRASMLWNMAHRRAKAAGVSYQDGEAQLRAEYAAWIAARDGARAHYMTRELGAAADDTAAAEGQAVRAVLDYPARSADALLIKLHIRAVTDRWDFSTEEGFWRLIADVRRVVEAGPA